VTLRDWSIECLEFASLETRAVRVLFTNHMEWNTDSPRACLWCRRSWVLMSAHEHQRDTREHLMSGAIFHDLLMKESDRGASLAASLVWGIVGHDSGVP